MRQPKREHLLGICIEIFEFVRATIILGAVTRAQPIPMVDLTEVGMGIVVRSHGNGPLPLDELSVFGLLYIHAHLKRTKQQGQNRLLVMMGRRERSLTELNIEDWNWYNELQHDYLVLSFHSNVSVRGTQLPNSAYI